MEYVEITKEDYERIKVFFTKKKNGKTIPIPKDVLETFVNIANAYKLNPFLKEIMLIPYGDTYDIRIGKDGLIAQANQHPDFLSVDSAKICENDEYSMDIPRHVINHLTGLPHKRGGIVGAWARVNRKNKPPVIVEVLITEYYDDGSKMWKKYETAMIEKVAISKAIKLAYGVSGVYTSAEIGDDGDYSDALEGGSEDLLLDSENQQIPQIADKTTEDIEIIEKVQQKPKKIIIKKEDKPKIGEDIDIAQIIKSKPEKPKLNLGLKLNKSEPKKALKKEIKTTKPGQLKTLNLGGLGKKKQMNLSDPSSLPADFLEYFKKDWLASYKGINYRQNDWPLKIYAGLVLSSQGLDSEFADIEIKFDELVKNTKDVTLLENYHTVVWDFIQNLGIQTNPDELFVNFMKSHLDKLKTIDIDIADPEWESVILDLFNCSEANISWFLRFIKDRGL